MEWTLLKETLKGIWPMLTIFLVVLISVRITYLKVNHEKFVFYKEFLNLIFVIYALLTNSELNESSGFNIVPFTEILRYKVGSYGFYWNVIGNIVMFIPFGYFVSSYVKASKVSHILVISVITSATVEFVQHFIGRSFDVDDILLNVLGAIIGFLLYIGFTAIKKHLPRMFRSDTFYNILCVIVCIIVLIYFLKISGIHIM